MANVKKNLIELSIIFLLVAPIFFSIENGFYKENLNYISKSFTNTPLPISLYLIILLFSFYTIKERKYFLLDKDLIFIIFIFSIVFILNLIFYKKNQLILLGQFFIPWLGFFIGKKINNKYTFHFLFFFLCIFQGVQIIYALINQNFFLESNLYFFKIYQHLQYVIVIFVFLSILVSINLHRKYPKKILILNIITFIYSCLSFSLSAIGLQSMFILVLIYRYFKNGYFSKILLVFVTSIFISLFLVYPLLINKFSDNKYYYSKSTVSNFDKKEFYPYISKINEVLKLKVPNNVELRLIIFKSYIDEIQSNPKIYLAGSQNYKLDKKYNSAHNLLLDIIYKFGVFLTIPYFYFIFLAIKKIMNEVDPEIKYSLFFIILFIILENSIKVPLKQPYSGILILYFLSNFIYKRK